MYRLLIILFLVAFSLSAKAQRIDAQPESVIIYRNGALITRSTTTYLSAGTHELIVTGFSDSLIPHSIRVKVSDNISILKVHYEKAIDFYHSQPGYALFSDSLDNLNHRLRHLKNKETALAQEWHLLKINQKITAKGGDYIDDLEEAADFYRVRIAQVLDLQDEAARQERVLKGYITQLQHSLPQLPTGEIHILYNAPNDANTSFIISYITKGAHWQPYYEMNIIDSGKAVITTYAAINQLTHENWTGAHISLNTHYMGKFPWPADSITIPLKAFSYLPADSQTQSVGIRVDTLSYNIKNRAWLDSGIHPFIFLHLSHWSNLGNGIITLYNDNQEITEGTTMASDSLDIPVGKNENITIERFLISHKRHRKYEEFEYALQISSRMRKVLNVEVITQLPYSSEIKTKGSREADYNPAKRELIWNITLKAGQQRTINYGYEIK